MPSIATHQIFGRDILKHLDKKTLKNIDKQTFLTFTQSHDYLYYYIFNPLKSREIIKLGSTAHKTKTQEFILNIIKYIKKNNLENNKQVVGYLYGILSHYVMDTNFHPYIFYKTGVDRNNKETRKYQGMHNKMEKDLDAIFYKKATGKNFNMCKVPKEIIGKINPSKELKNTIDFAYKETYDKENISKYLLGGIKHTKISYTLLIDDRFGIKKFIYKIINLLSFKHLNMLPTYSTYIKNPDISYLNLEKKEWNHPSYKEIKYNDSIEDLYNKSLTKFLNIIKEVNKVIYNNKSIDSLKNVIEDLDYITGLPIKDKKIMCYFEY